MPKLPAEPTDVDTVEEFFQERDGLQHLRARKRADVITIISGEADDLDTHARVRRETVQYWRLEMPAGTSSWERTPVRGPLREVLAELAESFGWTLAPRF